MDYESFKEKFVEDLKDRLDEQGADVKVSVNTVNKLNESYEAVTVTPEGSNIGVNIGIDKFYDAMENGRSYNEVVDKAVEVVNSGIIQRPDFDIDSLSDYSQMKEKLAMEVASAEANKEMLETVPHQNMEDMAVVYRFVLNSDDDGRASILVTNQLLESMGVTPEQLHADAMENAPQIKPVEIKGMSEVMAEMMGVEQSEMMGLYPVAPEDEKIFVATVPDKVHIPTEVCDSYSNNTEINNTDISDINPILSGTDVDKDERSDYREYLIEQLDMAVLYEQYPYDREILDAIMDMMLDVICSKRKTIRIAGDDKPVNVVKSQFMKLNCMHVEYVMKKAHTFILWGARILLSLPKKLTP